MHANTVQHQTNIACSSVPIISLLVMFLVSESHIEFTLMPTNDSNSSHYISKILLAMLVKWYGGALVVSHSFLLHILGLFVLCQQFSPFHFSLPSFIYVFGHSLAANSILDITRMDNFEDEVKIMGNIWERFQLVKYCQFGFGC